MKQLFNKIKTFFLIALVFFFFLVFPKSAWAILINFSGISMTGVDVSQVGWALPDTGQTTCYNATTTITCEGADGANFPGQDADYLSNAPSYTVVSNTVVDNNTGKIWQRYGHGSSNGYTVPTAVGSCATGGSYSADYCKYSWQNALKYCSNLTLDSKSDWRLPNAKELPSIVKYGVSYPAIDTTNFLYTKPGGYWSSTTYSAAASVAWYGDFSLGGVYSWAKASASGDYVRCVRGE